MTASKPRPIPVPLSIGLDPKFHRLADSAGQDLLAHSVGGYAQELADDLGLSARVRTSVSIAAGEPSGRLPYGVSVNEQTCRLPIRGSLDWDMDAAGLTALISGDVFDNRELFVSRTLASRVRRAWIEASAAALQSAVPPAHLQAFLESLAAFCLRVDEIPAGTDWAAGAAAVLEDALRRAAGVTLTVGRDELPSVDAELKEAAAREIEQPFFEKYGLVIPPVKVVREESQKAGIRLWINQLRTPPMAPPGKADFAQLRSQIFRSAGTLVTEDSVRLALNLVRERFPRLVDTSLARFPLVTLLTRTMRELVAESIPVRHMRGVLEALLNLSGETAVDLEEKIVFGSNAGDLCPVDSGSAPGPEELADCVRIWMKSPIALAYSQTPNRMTVNLVHPEVEEWIRQRRHTGLGPEERQKLISAVVDAIGVDDGAGGYRVILTTFKVRRALRRFLEKELPTAIVLSYQELPAELTISPAKRISW